MSVLIVVPCLNEERHLPQLLPALLAENPEALVVVADGGSTDGSRAIVADLARTHPQLVLMDNPRRLQAAGVNLAARRHGGGGRWLVRVDAHCAYPAGYVAGLVAAAEQVGATSVVVPMVTAGITCFQSAVAAAQNSRLGNGGSPHRNLGQGRWVDHGHHALFDMALFLAVGGYDESFSHNEDAELDVRLAQAGGRLWLEPSLALTYFPRRAPAPLLAQYRNYGRGRARNRRRHRLRLALRQIVPLAVAPLVCLALLGLLAAGVDRRALWLAVPALAWAGLCLAYGGALAWRQRSSCVLCAGLAAMLMHLGWSFGFLEEQLWPRHPS
ncbi:MAG TPA: glycosyltransferase family 2 protein [Novosphingobium sp.]|nr:glycosyltransferase family 2 protein [Novosphingobium sp.]